MYHRYRPDTMNGPHDYGYSICEDGGCHFDGDIYACAAKGCVKYVMCEECTHTCADCQKTFCVSCVDAITVEGEEIHVCEPCENRRNETNEPTETNERQAA